MFKKYNLNGKRVAIGRLNDCISDVANQIILAGFNNSDELFDIIEEITSKDTELDVMILNKLLQIYSDNIMCISRNMLMQDATTLELTVAKCQLITSTYNRIISIVRRDNNTTEILTTVLDLNEE